MKKTSCYFVLALLICTNAFGQASSFLPDPAHNSNWQLNSEPAIYQGDKLYELINGGAEAYHEYGFEEVVSAYYTYKGSPEIKIHIYQMSDPSAAFGIFSSLHDHESDTLAHYGTMGAWSPYYLMFWMNKYYIMISSSSKSPQVNDAIQEMGLFISSKGNSASKLPILVQQVQNVGADAFELKYITGPIGISNNYIFSSKDIFETKQGVFFSLESRKYFLLKYPSSNEAASVFAKLKEEFAQSTRFNSLVVTEDGFQMKDRRDQPLRFRLQQEHILCHFNAQDNDKSLELELNF